MKHKVSVFDAKTNLSKLIELVNQGEVVEITNRGKVVAELVPPKIRKQNGYGVLAGLLPDFDWEEADLEFNSSFNPNKF